MNPSGKARCPGCNGKRGLAELSVEGTLTWADYEGITWSRNAKGSPLVLSVPVDTQWTLSGRSVDTTVDATVDTTEMLAGPAKPSESN